MTERPILFSGEMVRAILAGRKMQTRRLVTLHTSEVERAIWNRADLARAWVDPGFGAGAYLHAPLRDVPGDPADERIERIRCRVRTGDRLWVKETFFVNHVDHVRGPLPDERPTDITGEPCEILYRADGEIGDQVEQGGGPDAIWRPSIFCKRWASRIALDVKAVRVERLQDISEEDAKAEGVGPSPCRHTIESTDGGVLEGGSHRLDYASLWDTINGARAQWTTNPWVFVYEFTRAHA